MIYVLIILLSMTTKSHYFEIQCYVLMVLCLNDSDSELIYLTDGASKGVMQILQTIIRGQSDGVLDIFLSIKLNIFFLIMFVSDKHHLKLFPVDSEHGVSCMSSLQILFY